MGQAAKDGNYHWRQEFVRLAHWGTAIFQCRMDPKRPHCRIHPRSAACLESSRVLKTAVRFCALVFCFAAVTSAAVAQEIRLYSEFERFDPFGNPVAADRDMAPREIVSPAMARNGHLSMHVVVTAPKGTNYFLYAASNPPGILQIKVYREFFTPCGDSYCPDWLTEQNLPSFGAIPESLFAMRGQISRSYLLDMWAPPDTPPRRVRVEALLKVGIWLVAPMEVRIVAPVVPEASSEQGRLENIEENIAPVEMQSSATAHIQMLRYLAGLPIQSPPRILRVRDIIQRNAAEDMRLARSIAFGYPDLNLMSWWPFVFPEFGSEWYLKVRDFLYRF